MSPFEKAQRVYLVGQSARTFHIDLWLHLERGWVFSNPRLFAMGRPVVRGWTYQQLTDPCCDAKNPDCWWVFLAAGSLLEIVKLLPYPLPFVGWERDGAVKIWELNQLLTHLGKVDLPPHLTFPLHHRLRHRLLRMFKKGAQPRT